MGPELTMLSTSRPSEYIRSAAGKDFQRQLWTETLKEMSRHTTLHPEWVASA